MGISGNDLRLLIELKKSGHIPNECSVVEIGAQQLSDDFLACRSDLDTAMQLFGIAHPNPLPPPLAPTPTKADVQLLDPSAPWARHFWTWLGLHYAAIDIDGSPGSIPLDLNYDDVPSKSKGNCQLV